MRLTTVVVVVTLALASLMAPLVAGAQQAPQVPRIGLLTPGPWGPRLHLLEAFRQGLRERGYVEGQNIALVLRSAEGSSERLPDLAAELVRLPVDLLVALGAPAAQAAKHTTSTLPIVVVAGDVLGSGLVASLAQPGGNITGVTPIAPDLAGKRLEVLKEVVPALTRVAILWNPTNPAKPPEWREMQIAAQTLGITLQSLEVRAFEAIERAFVAMEQERPDALIVFEDPLTVTHRTQIVALATAARLPDMYAFREFAEAGGLMAYGPSLREMYRRTAYYVDRILKGTKPAALPVEQPMRFELVVNLKTAQTLGLTLPLHLLASADEVIR